MKINAQLDVKNFFSEGSMKFSFIKSDSQLCATTLCAVNEENFITDYRNFTAYLREKCHLQLFLLNIIQSLWKFFYRKLGSFTSDVHRVMGFNFTEVFFQSNFNLEGVSGPL